MRAFFRTDIQHKHPSASFASAADGFRDLGWECVRYQDVHDILPQLEREDVVVDFIDETCAALRHLGIAPPSLPTYPDPLRHLLGRKIWASSINAVAAQPDMWPVFVKPRDDAKSFTGVLVRGPRDLVGCGSQGADTPVWCSEPVRMLAEWRCFVRYGQVLDVRPYRGDWRLHFDPAVIEQAVAAWDGQPKGCALDFALDGRGRTLLIEANDGFALGSYGLRPRDYARLLAARWAELAGTPDSCDF